MKRTYYFLLSVAVVGIPIFGMEQEVKQPANFTAEQAVQQIMQQLQKYIRVPIYAHEDISWFMQNEAHNIEVSWYTAVPIYSATLQLIYDPNTQTTEGKNLIVDAVRNLPYLPIDKENKNILIEILLSQINSKPTTKIKKGKKRRKGGGRKGEYPSQAPLRMKEL